MRPDTAARIEVVSGGRAASATPSTPEPAASPGNVISTAATVRHDWPGPA
jgi:hypothetical protein